MFDLDKLKEKATALANVFKKDDEEEKDERSSVKKLTDFQKAKEVADMVSNEEDKKIASIDDTGETKSIEQILEDESAKKEEKSKEKDLDEKLADIEKVISTFTEEKPLGTGKDPFSKSTTFDLNKPIDFSKSIAKTYVQPFIQQPSSQKDRVALLYESLRKQNLI